MDFEEEFLIFLKGIAQKDKDEYIQKYGTVDQMSRADRSFYAINYESTTKRALRYFYDKINCGGYAFEIKDCFFPNGQPFSNYVSGILDALDFVRLLGDTSLQDDEYMVLYRFHDYGKNDGKNCGHHFVKVEPDGLVVEKNGSGRPFIFKGWNKSYQDSPEAIFAVKKKHYHYIDATADDISKIRAVINKGLNFEETVSNAIASRTNDFSYHSHNYRLKKSKSGEIVIVSDNGKIVASVLTKGQDTIVEVLEEKEQDVENLTGKTRPIIKNGKVQNMRELRGIPDLER